MCPEAVCEVPEEYGHARWIVLEFVLASNWWLEVVVGISLAIHALFLLLYLGHLLPEPASEAHIGRHVVGFHTPSPARRSLARELL